MKPTSISNLKKELTNASKPALLEICLRLAKFKKENKELLTYILFEEHNLGSYIQDIQKEIDEQFADINTSSLYYVKKSLRKIVRFINKHVKYISSKEAEAELRIYFCNAIKSAGIKINKSRALANLYDNQIKKLTSVIASLHPDLQHDFNKQIGNLL